MTVAVALSTALLLQVPATPHPAAEPEAPLVHVVTLGPGPALWERFGHNAIVIEDRSTGAAVAYDWGRFDFGEEGFVLKFVRGRMRYWMASAPAAPFLAYYRRSGRSVRVQTLDLEPAERLALARLLRANDTDAARYYRYDYYLDNCSTRVRDALDAVLGGGLGRAWRREPTGTTFRGHTRRLLASMPVTLAGMDALLGPVTDRDISGWEEGFLPRLLADRIGTATHPGTGRPLVLHEEMAVEGTLAERDTPPLQWPWYLVLGLGLGGLLAWSADRAPAVTRLVGGAWAVLSGLVGLVGVTMWAFTDHAVVRGNLNVLLLPATGLILAWCLGRRPAGRGARWFATLGLALGALAVIVAALGVVPQDLRRVAALALPAHLGLLVSLRRLKP